MKLYAMTLFGQSSPSGNQPTIFRRNLAVVRSPPEHENFVQPDDIFNYSVTNNSHFTSLESKIGDD